MPTGSSHASELSATGVHIAIGRDPSLVRTVRLVAAAVARRAGLEDEALEEIRMAVGEACAVLVSGLSGGVEEHDPDDRVVLSMDVGERLMITVSCAGAEKLPPSPYDAGRIDAWALLRGLTDDLVVTEDDQGVGLTMSWLI